jgi:hypothetical protein
MATDDVNAKSLTAGIAFGLIKHRGTKSFHFSSRLTAAAARCRADCVFCLSLARNYIDIYHNHNDAYYRLSRPLSERITRIAICCDKQSICSVTQALDVIMRRDKTRKS